MGSFSPHELSSIRMDQIGRRIWYCPIRRARREGRKLSGDVSFPRVHTYVDVIHILYFILFLGINTLIVILCVRALLRRETGEVAGRSCFVMSRFNTGIFVARGSHIRVVQLWCFREGWRAKSFGNPSCDRRCDVVNKPLLLAETALVTCRTFLCRFHSHRGCSRVVILNHNRHFRLS